MKMKFIFFSIALISTLPSHAQTQAIDTAQFVAVYDYECRTQNDEGTPVTDKMQVVVQVGRLLTKSMPFSAYSRTEELEETDIVASYQEALMHMPTVWIELPSGYTTVREFIFPREYDSTEETPEIKWVLSEDTMTVCGYFCQKATAMFRGVEWNVYYTEDIPSSAGPWRLSGLPGLIVEAKSDAHTFHLAELRQESSPITTPDQNPDVQRVKYEKLMKYRNEIYGNSKYAGNPLYYIAEFQNGTISLGGTINHMDVMDFGGKQYIYVDGHPLLTKAHVYQPLEGK